MGLDESLGGEHQPHADLFAVGALVVRIAPPGLGIGRGLALEAGGGEVVEQHRVPDPGGAAGRRRPGRADLRPAGGNPAPG